MTAKVAQRNCLIRGTLEGEVGSDRASWEHGRFVNHQEVLLSWGFAIHKSSYPSSLTAVQEFKCSVCRLGMGFDKPQPFINATRNLGKDVRRVGIIQLVGLIDCSAGLTSKGG